MPNQKMKRDDHPTSIANAPNNGGSAGGVLASLADTTWRVAVPTVLFSGLGIFVDNKLDTPPLWTIIGLLVGLAGAGALIWRQVREVTKTEGTK